MAFNSAPALLALIYLVRLKSFPVQEKQVLNALAAKQACLFPYISLFWSQEESY